MSHLTRLIRLVRHWHARFGVVAALFFIMLSITGMALNHTDSLSLDKIQVKSPLLMRWYGLQSEPPQTGYIFSSGYFVGNHEHWVMDDKLLPQATGEVLGVVDVAGLRHVATAQRLHIYHSNGELLESLHGASLPVNKITRIGVAGNLLVLASSEETVVTEDSLSWQPYDESDHVTWAAATTLPPDLVQRIAKHFRPSLSLERILLDVHSGRLFGQRGPWLMDAVALILMLLSFSGLWIYLKTVRRKR